MSEGLNALLTRNYSPGRPPHLTPEQQDVLRSEVSKPEGFSSYQQIIDYIEKTFDVKMNYKAVHTLVHYKWKLNSKCSVKVI